RTKVPGSWPPPLASYTSRRPLDPAHAGGGGAVAAWARRARAAAPACRLRSPARRTAVLDDSTIRAATYGGMMHWTGWRADRHMGTTRDGRGFGLRDFGRRARGPGPRTTPAPAGVRRVTPAGHPRD